jgi:hypothetical protein
LRSAPTAFFSEAQRGIDYHHEAVVRAGFAPVQRLQYRRIGDLGQWQVGHLFAEQREVAQVRCAALTFLRPNDQRVA